MDRAAAGGKRDSTFACPCAWVTLVCLCEHEEEEEEVNDL